MNDDEVQKQLDHMVKFIYREADEKASEIQAKAQEEASIEKARIVMEEKLKIMKEFERKEKQIETKIKIAYSNELNQSRLQLLKARDEGIQKIYAEAHHAVAAVTKDPTKYKKLLHDLIVQGLMKLDEPKVSVVCRKQDAHLVKDVLSGAVAEYTSKAKKQVDAEVESSLYLPAGPEENPNDFCSGGVILSSNGGRIICSNTLDARLNMAYEQQLPQIRETLFGKSTTRVHYT
eukprot:TRINITY_DN1251_c0_g1_i2.p1 TRINITY_DN1251_c0_g1~~TRINITY_DN1251_c0_g1_i2.p1  ORF type:complete len:233 (+),score=100.77 TRINITY_DN1251_c0_g1_i2:107-805(+)